MGVLWDDAWPSREGVPRIWKRTDKPWPGAMAQMVTEDGRWRYPWYYRIPGWCSCYAATWEDAMARVRQYWFEVWLDKTFPSSSYAGFSEVTYPWVTLPEDHKPPGVYC